MERLRVIHGYPIEDPKYFSAVKIVSVQKDLVMRVRLAYVEWV
ncbi:MAG: hypothetical protein RTV41_10845 [Candidatus Thorarchaeota archaeon]